MSAELAVSEGTDPLDRKTRSAPQSQSHEDPDLAQGLASSSTRSQEGHSVETRRQRCLALLFPYLKLYREQREDTRQLRCLHGGHPKLAEAFVVSAILWLAMAFLTIYLMLVISSTTFQLTYVQDHVATLQKAPRVGKHYLVVLVAKGLMQVLLMHHLCGNLMEPLVEMRGHHTADLDAMLPTGVVQCMLRVWNCILRRDRGPRWFSCFLADHVLLLCVGTLALFNEVNLLMIKIECLKEELVDLVLLVDVQQSAPLEIMNAALCFYCSVLVMGFLLTTLEESVVAKPHRSREYSGTMALFLLLWSSQFLVILFDRQVYTSAWIDTAPGTRMLAAAAMVFVTHSSVMLGAVFCGHSAHFKRCPDLTWRMFASRIIPLLVVCAAVSVLLLIRSEIHTDESCYPTAFNLLVRPWPYFWTAWTTIGGGVLLFLALRDMGEEAHGERSEELSETETLGSILDYDTMLVLVTFSSAVVWNVAKVYEMEADGAVVSALSYFFALLAPLGLAAFALVIWKRPPRMGTTRSRAIWFALVFTAVLFADFQEKEDCEISAELPSCCSYPWFSNEEKALQCNKPLRCELHPNCIVDDDHEPHPQALSARRLHGGRRLRESSGTPHFSQEECELLSRRWQYYLTNTSAEGTYIQAMQDAVNEEEHLSTAFRIFVTFGQAANVEAYFTIFGVLLKVLLLTHHPKSGRILGLDSYHSRSDSGGNHVVAVPGVGRRWATVRAARSLGLLDPTRRSRMSTPDATPAHAADPDSDETSRQPLHSDRPEVDG